MSIRKTHNNIAHSQHYLWIHWKRKTVSTEISRKKIMYTILKTFQLIQYGNFTEQVKIFQIHYV